MSFFTPTSQGYLLRLTVSPGARHTAVVGLYGDRLKVRVAAAPEKRGRQPGTHRLPGPGLESPQRRLPPHRGPSSRSKTVEIRSLSTDLAARLEALLAASP